MTHKQSAKRLAKALYFVAEKKQDLDSVQNSLEQIKDLVKTVPEFRAFVQSKKIEK